jgi:hypothetical protein
MRLSFLVLLVTFAIVTVAALSGGCEPGPEVTLQIEFPAKKEDRVTPYWFIAARGYSI